ncbi:beta-propeller fold lactonase family protein [Roseovarius aestuarii]|nr:beta-propeller fold lactonase family protein [Roseovarius aestuarii]
MALLMGDIVNRTNVNDNAIFQLQGAFGVHTVTANGRTFVYVAGNQDDGLTGFEVLADGTLADIGVAISDTAALNLRGAQSLTSVTIGANTYLYANGPLDDGLSVFRVEANGALTSAQNVSDAGLLNLDGASGRMTTANVAGINYLVAAGRNDDGISVFSIAADGTLTNTDNVDDSVHAEATLDFVNSVASIDIGNSTYVFATSPLENGVSRFQLDAAGSLIFLDSTTDADSVDLQLNGASNLATAHVGTQSYLFVSGSTESGISVFRIGAAGALSNVFNIQADDTLKLAEVNGLTTFEIEGETFLAASATGDDALVLFHVATNGVLTEIDTYEDGINQHLDTTYENTFVNVDGTPVLIGTGALDNGLSTFELGAEDDRLIAGNYQDTLLGLAGDDHLEGRGADDVLSGGKGDDFLNGGGADDSLSGGDGNDILLGGDGDDTLEGGADDDIIIGGYQPGMIRMNTNLTTNQYIGVDDYIMPDGDFTIEMMYRSVGPQPGTSSNLVSYFDSAPGGANALGIYTRNFGDEESAFALNGQFYDSGQPSDQLNDGELHRVSLSYNATSGETIMYVDGIELFRATADTGGLVSGGALIFGQEQDSEGGGFSPNEILSGDIGDIRLWSDVRTAEEIRKNAFVQITDPAGADNLAANWVVDPTVGFSVPDVVGGASLIKRADGGGAFPVTLANLPDNGADRAFDGRGDDFVSLGDGDDYVRAGGGADTYDGGAGTDYISYYDSSGGVDIDFAANTATGSWANNDVVTGFEGGSGSGTGDDTFSGTDGANLIRTYGGDDRVYDHLGADSISLGSGDDYIRVGGGQDSYDGGSGTDYISYYDSSGGVTLDLAANTASGSWASNDTIENFESASGSRNGDDEISGTSGSNVIRTYGGDDRVYDRGGADTVELGSGDDYLRAGGGADSYDGGSGTDYISYYDSSGGVDIDFAANTATGSWANNDTVENFEGGSGSGTGDDTFRGTDGDNIIRTYGGDDDVYDRDGDDLIQLGSGDDYLRAGGGADTYDGGSGTDYISYYDSAGGVDLDFRSNLASGSWANNDVVQNFEGASGSNTGDDTLRGTDGESILRGYGGNDRLHGYGGDDSLVGGSGDDSLYGADGADTMRGGSGNDYLDGGGGTGTDLLYGDAGQDVFHFDRGEGNDVIKDFENNIDVIELDNFAGFATAADALALAVNVDGDVFFDFGADGTLLVENATKAQLANDIDIV